MAEAIFMPRLGQSVEICIITKWFKNKGDFVQEGDLLFAYETDKAAFEESAKTSGQLLDIFYNEGDEVPVLANVAVIGKEGEATDEFDPGGKQSVSKEKTDSINDTVDKKEIKPVDSVETEKVIENTNLRISPRARNMAADHGIDTASLNGTGPNGRIIARDIENYILAGESKKPVKLQKDTSEKIITGKDFTITPPSNLRKIIASSMFASLQNSAQLTHHLGADARKILALREKVKLEKETGKVPNITINDMVSYALIRALIKMPLINSHYTDAGIKVFNKIHLGVAVDTERGLMVPALRNADDYSLRGLSAQLKILSDKCRKGNIEPDLLQSEASSFTISNLGSFGVELFTPVINLPQTGILGVNAITYRPADMGDGIIGFVPYIGLSLTYDHRALDGAPASAFLREIKMQIEQFDASIR